MASVLGITPRAVRGWLGREGRARSGPVAGSTGRRGRPPVLPEPVRERLRQQYRDTYGQWGPAVLALWACRSGLGQYSPSTVGRAIADLREPEAPPRPAETYEVAAAGVMWAEDGAGFREWGRKKELLVLQDECARYKVNHRLADGPATEDDVHDYLEEAFRIHGPPLVLKHDNGTVFHSQKVRDLLARHQVVELRGPPRCPRYNGRKERSFRDVRSYEKAMHRRRPGAPLRDRLDEAIDDLNHRRPRPVLKGRIAIEAFLQDRRALPDRAAFLEQVRVTEEKLRQEAVTRTQLDSARRRAVEEVLSAHGLLITRRSLSTDFLAQGGT